MPALVGKTILRRLFDSIRLFIVHEYMSLHVLYMYMYISFNVYLYLVMY